LWRRLQPSGITIGGPFARQCGFILGQRQHMS
jgi:putative AlgH/UPF0301 family transcriptional regulator